MQVKIPEKVDLPAREPCKSGVSKVNAVCFFFRNLPTVLIVEVDSKRSKRLLGCTALLSRVCRV